MTFGFLEERIVRDGRIWTSAGIDLALAFIASLAGDEVVGKVQLGTEYYPSAAIYGHSNRNPKAPGYIRQRAVSSR